MSRVALTVFGPDTAFHLSATPANATQIQVVVNGQPTTGWTYSPATNSVVFTTASAPPPGSSIGITYPLGC